MATYHVSEEGKIRQQIHIPERLEEDRRKFPKSTVNTQSPSEQVIDVHKHKFNTLTVVLIFYSNIQKINQTND